MGVSVSGLQCLTASLTVCVTEVYEILEIDFKTVTSCLIKSRGMTAVSLLFYGVISVFAVRSRKFNTISTVVAQYFGEFQMFLIMLKQSE